MSRGVNCSDDELSAAIAASTSWRGTLRELGLVATSSATIKSIRARAEGLGLDYTHFRGQRRWTDAQLREAIGESRTWDEVVEKLPLVDTSDIALIKGHTSRLGIETSHLTARGQDDIETVLLPGAEHLDRAGPLLAAAWFTLCGCDVSWPLEPSRYDLLVSSASGIRRVQVKTTRTRAAGTWKVYLSTSRRARRTYDPDEIDDFFIIDGDLEYYLIPVSDVGGFHALHLRGYERYRQDRLIAGTAR